MQVKSETRLARRLALAGTLLTAVVVLLGAWTRLVDAGLGCPDWPGCYGELVVPDATTALLHSPTSPLEVGKAWAEMIHRYFAASLGLLVLVLTLLAWRLRHVPSYPQRVSWLLLIVILAQGAFGAFTVTLKLWPQVVTLHLLGGLSITALFLWLYLRLGRVNGERQAQRPAFRLHGLWLLAGGALLLQLALGGWTTSNYAGIACQGFPSCNEQWWPAMDWREGFNLAQSIGPNYLYGALHAEARTAIHVGHRLGAIVLGAALLLLARRYWQQRELRRPLLLLLGGYVLQVALGVANVLLALPLGLALAHTAGAMALVLALTFTLWRVVTPVKDAARWQRPSRSGYTEVPTIERLSADRPTA